MTYFDPLNPLSGHDQNHRGDRYRDAGQSGQSIWPLVVLVGLIAGLGLIASI